MALFTSEQVERIILRGESELSADIPFLVDRLSLHIIKGTAEYTIPDYVQSIRRVTWLGLKIDPVDHRRYRGFVNNGQQGTPYTYVFNNIAQNQIAFYYVPNVNIAAGVVDLWVDDIPTAVIIEFWRVSDGSTFKIPDYFRRRLLKLYLATKTYQLESPGQQGRLARYYKTRWDEAVADFGSHINDLINKPRKLVVGGPNLTGQQLIGGLRLPSQFGQAVDAEGD